MLSCGMRTIVQNLQSMGGPLTDLKASGMSSAVMQGICACCGARQVATLRTAIRQSGAARDPRIALKLWDCNQAMATASTPRVCSNWE